MKLFRNISITVGTLLMAFLFMGTGSNKTVTGLGQSVATYTGTYAASQVDTIKWVREDGVSGVSFALRYKDSVSVLYARVRREIDGKAETLVSTDTITAFTAYADSSTAAPSGSVVGTVTLAPLADVYWVQIAYTARGQGVTTPTCKYEFIKQYYHK